MSDPTELQNHLAALSRKVAKHRAIVDKAAERVALIEADLASVLASHNEAPSDKTRAGVAAARSAVEKAKAAHAEASAVLGPIVADEEQASLKDIRARQTAHAQQLRLEKLAVQRPEVAEVYEEAKAKGLALAAVRATLTERESELERAQDRIAELETQLAAALKPKAD